MAANRNPAHQRVGAAAAVVVPGRRDPVLDAARVLMLYGVVGAVATVGSGSSSPGDAIGSLVLWLLGVWLLLLTFVPAVARRAALVAAAVALGYFFTLSN